MEMRKRRLWYLGYVHARLSADGSCLAAADADESGDG
jgi:hypothetical protein